MSNQTILLVEDNPDDEALTVRAFQKNKIANKIVVAPDGVKALEYLFAESFCCGRDPEELPQVVLLDINLPKIHGLEVLRRIRANERTRHLPVVMLTSSKEEQDLVDSYRCGANSYIPKPVNYEDFVEAARQLGLYWLVLNQVPAGIAK